MRIATTAQALAPEVMPMMSGLASGLRTMDWKMAPEIPKQTPTATPMSARGQPELVDDEVRGPGRRGR